MLFPGHEIWLDELLVVPCEEMTVETPVRFESPNFLRVCLEKFLCLETQGTSTVASELS